ncbi:MAG TPA: hypothetical protein DCK79_02205 [Candidatus Atribacteria bacterium]|nr:MAG: Inactivated Zn-dependent peptidase [Atribacteria bacterium 34_128]HAJ32175.1 hypothetical protein [Candidatus Atribacteria bacterium]
MKGNIYELESNIKKVLKKESHAEIYFSNKETHCFEINDKQEKNYSLFSDMGIAARVFDGKRIGFSSRPGFSEDDINSALEDARENIKFTNNNFYIPFVRKKSQCHFIPKFSSSDINPLDYLDEDLFKVIDEKAYKTGLSLKNIYFYSKIEQFLLINTVQVQGGGTANLYSLGFNFHLKNEKLDECFIITTISPKVAKIDVDEVISQAKKVANTKIIASLRKKIIDCPILLTHNAVSIIIYVFLSLLTSESIFHKRSFISNKNANISFGNQLTIVENSKINKIYNANIDREGISRREVKIIEKGELCNIISDTKYGTKMKIASTSSAWRDSYQQMPKVKATSISVEAGIFSTEEIINRYNQIFIIDDLMGIASGINPNTSDFQVTSEGYLINNKGLLGRARVFFQSNLINLFNSIIEISKDREYGIDGSVYVPSFLIDSIKLTVI